MLAALIFLTHMAFAAVPETTQAPPQPAGPPPNAPIIGSSEAPVVDPYEKIEKWVLPNGLQVYLAPSDQATLTAVRVEVGVGVEVESAKNFGVSHLLEHVLFRNKNLKEEMTYLQLIREAGGEANGVTADRTTEYFASIPAQKGMWLLDRFYRMMFQPTITDEYVQKEKSTVELERGRPGPITQILGFNPSDFFFPSYLRQPSFWKTEFGTSFEDRFTLAQEQLSTRRLTRQQVQRQYDDYYYPANMKLYVGGKFDRAAVKRHLEDLWATTPAREGKKVPPLKEPHPRKAPYIRTALSTDQTPDVSVGTKFWDVTIEERSVINSYMEYLAHRLMKEIRNKKGQTYTARANSGGYRRYGYAVVEFETSKEHFRENLDFVNQHLRDEAEAGALTDTQVAEANRLYLSQYSLYAHDAANMVWFAQAYAYTKDTYGEFQSPVKVLSRIDTKTYNDILKKYFTPERRYQYVTEPPLFFAYDNIFLYIATLICALFLMKRLLRGPFEHNKVRWVRKVRYPPLMTVEILATIVAWFIYIHLDYVIRSVLTRLAFFQASLFFSTYFLMMLDLLLFVAIVQGLLALLPKKLMVEGHDLLIKSITYFSRRVPLSSIQNVQARTFLTYPFPLPLWYGKVKHRLFFVNPLFWKKGLLIELTDGRAYFFSMRNAPKAARELQSLVQQNRGVLGER